MACVASIITRAQVPPPPRPPPSCARDNRGARTWHALYEPVGVGVRDEHVLQHAPGRAQGQHAAGREAAHAVAGEGVNARLVERAPRAHLAAERAARTPPHDSVSPLGHARANSGSTQAVRLETGQGGRVGEANQAAALSGGANAAVESQVRNTHRARWRISCAFRKSLLTSAVLPSQNLPPLRWTPLR
jgi:hypothetical protein